METLPLKQALSEASGVLCIAMGIYEEELVKSLKSIKSGYIENLASHGLEEDENVDVLNVLLKVIEEKDRCCE